MPPASASRTPSISTLTGLRGYAAIWVVVSHLLYTDTLAPSVTRRFEPGRLNGILRHEYLAVDLFFMLSGFVLTHAHAREMDEGVQRRTYGRFLLLRLARVYPLHLVALLAILVLNHFTPNPLPSSNAGCFVLQTTLMASWGLCTGVSWNSPAWSLSSEWLAYLLFPLVLLATSSLKTLRAQLVALTAIFVAFIGVFFSYYYFGTFQFETDYSNGAGASGRVLFGVVLGSTLRRLYDQPRVRALPWTWIFALTLPLAAFSMSDWSGRRLDNNPWCYLAMLLMLFAAACASPPRLPMLASRPAVYMGEISYAIYIFHFPVLLAEHQLWGAWLDRTFRDAPPLVADALFAGAVGSVILAAALAHHAVEEPARKWARARIERRFAHHPRQPASQGTESLSAA